MSHFPQPSSFYSSSTNPNLKNFVLSQQPPSNSILPQYSITEPLKKDYMAKKTGPVYAMHRYWTKQPISVIKKYISSFCPPNGLVLDPFCGTGTTGTAALYSGRSVVLLDLSPIATFIAKNYTELTDIAQVKKAVFKLKTRIKTLLDKTYSTSCFQCGGVGIIKDWLYSEVYECSFCASSVPFILPGTPWHEIESLKHRKNLICLNCGKLFSRDSAIFLKILPIGLRYSCKNCKLRKELKILGEVDSQFLEQMSLKDWHPSVPQYPLPVGVNTNQPFSRKITSTHQFFTKTTANILGSLWQMILDWPNPIIRSKLQFIFSSVIYRVTRLYRLRVKGQGGVLSGTLYLPPVAQDINVWDVFTERFRKILRGWENINHHLSTAKSVNCIISTQSATNLFNVPSNSIDYVYTDPPYGGNINYSELNLLWEAWFGLTTNTTEEVIINESGQSKSILEYKILMQRSLDEIIRVLKPNRWLTLVFNSSTPKIWSVIQESLINAGFLISKEISRIGSKMTTAKQTASKKTARKYFLINVQKPNHVLTEKKVNNKFIETVSGLELEILIKNRVHNFLKNKTPSQASYDEIYDEIITHLITDISIQDFNLEKILNKFFSSVSKDHWKI
jgi:DNA modification methylase